MKTVIGKTNDKQGLQIDLIFSTSEHYCINISPVEKINETYQKVLILKKICLPIKQITNNQNINQ